MRAYGYGGYECSVMEAALDTLGLNPRVRKRRQPWHHVFCRSIHVANRFFAKPAHIPRHDVGASCLSLTYLCLLVYMRARQKLLVGALISVMEVQVGKIAANGWSHLTQKLLNVPLKP